MSAIIPYDDKNIFTYVDDKINDMYDMKDGANLLQLIGSWNSLSQQKSVKPNNIDNYPNALVSIGNRKIYPMEKLPNAAIIPGKHFSPIIPPYIHSEDYMNSSYKNLVIGGSFKDSIKIINKLVLNISWSNNDKTIKYYIVSFTSSVGQQNIKTKKQSIDLPYLQPGKYVFCIYAINDMGHSPTDLFEVIVI